MKHSSPSRYAFSASSMTVSVVVHGTLFAGMVAWGTWAVMAEELAPVYRLEFEREVSHEVAATWEPEPLEQLEWPTAGDPEGALVPERIQLTADPMAFEDRPRIQVDDWVSSWPVSAEVVFGSPNAQAEPEPVAVEPTPVVPKIPQVAAPAPAPAAPPRLETPARIEGEDPVYPKASLRIREEGDVVLRLAIDEQGRVTLVELALSSGSRRLDQAAMSAAPTWRFEAWGAAPREGLVFEHTVHFRMDGR